MSTGAQSAKKRTKRIDYYKWIAGIAVPILVAVIGIAFKSGKGDSVINIGEIKNEYKQITGQPLTDAAVIAQLNGAANLAKAGQYEASRKALEQVSAAVPVPAVFTAIGNFYSGKGDAATATQYLQKAVALDGSYKPALETLNALKAPPPATPKPISVREAEPNNDIQHANILPVNKTIAAEITESDTDYFQFTTGHPPRDIYRISVKNLSTTLAPGISVFDQQKGKLFDDGRDTAGSDLDRDFSPAADQTYYVQVGARYNSQGAYSLTVSPQHRYDAFEPNDDIRSAKAISLGKTIEANIMDSGDTDYYQVTSGSANKLTASLKNTSTTLAPGIAVYDSQKNQITNGGRDTAGADMDFTWDVQPNTLYYVQIGQRYNSSGSYTLTIH